MIHEICPHQHAPAVPAAVVVGAIYAGALLLLSVVYFPLATANFVLLQWLGVRLARIVDDETGERSWGILWGVVPLTGWWTDYIGPAKLMRL